MNLDQNRIILAYIIFGVITLASSSAAPADTESKIVTLTDNGQTVNLQVNETFLLKLGEEYEWSISLDDQSVASRVINVAVVRGAQGIYRAHKAGSATLTAVGDPICRNAQPPCGAPSIQFHIDIVVEGAQKTSGPGMFLAILSLMAALFARRI